MRRIQWLPAALLLVAWIMCVPASSSHGEGLPTPITGSFLQLYDAHESWNDDQWDALFNVFQALGLGEIVVQWAKYQPTPKPGEDADAKPAAALRAVLGQAEKRGLEIWIGLAHDPGYWRSVGKTSRPIAGYLLRRRAQALRVAAEVAGLVRGRPSFRGFYISQEIDDINWVGAAKREALLHHLERLSLGLKGIMPEARIAMSGFANARMSPQSFAALWDDMLERTAVDRLLFQDGVGVHKLKPRHVGTFAAALHDVSTRHGADLTLIVEIFRQTEGEPVSDKPFAAVPADMERIRRQLETAAKYSKNGVLAFSVPEYMSPLGGREAAQLYEAYVTSIKALSQE